MDFKNKLEKAVARNKSLLCVGLDPNPQDLKGEKSQFAFNKRIIDQTVDFVCCFKPQIAFYAAAGLKGLEDLRKTIDYIHKNYPQIPVLLDAKRGDVAHTSEMYVKEVFDYLDADATTVNPYLGFDSLEPFFKRKNRGTFVLIRTTNLGAHDFQDLKTMDGPFYVSLAKKVVEWSKNYPNIGMVVASTWPKELTKIRQLAPSMLFLVPGIGAQGGDLKITLKNGLLHNGRGLIIAAARSIIYSSNPKKAAKNLRDEINKYR